MNKLEQVQSNINFVVNKNEEKSPFLYKDGKELISKYVYENNSYFKYSFYENGMFLTYVTKYPLNHHTIGVSSRHIMFFNNKGEAIMNEVLDAEAGDVDNYQFEVYGDKVKLTYETELFGEIVVTAELDKNQVQNQKETEEEFEMEI